MRSARTSPKWAEGHPERKQLALRIRNAVLADARSDIRTGIGMDADVTAVGQQFPAVDTGDCGTVFAPGGGDAWIADAAGSAFGACGILAWIWFVPVRMLRRSAMA